MSSLLPLLLLPLCWLLLVRPQRQRVIRQRQLLADLAPGDQVVTAGGLIGRVVSLSGDRVRLEVAPGVVVEVVAPAISGRTPAEPATTVADATEEAA